MFRSWDENAEVTKAFDDVRKFAGLHMGCHMDKVADDMHG